MWTYAAFHNKDTIKTPFKGDWQFWCHFVPYLLGYMYIKNCSNKERFDQVIAKKWCSFFASQCIVTSNRSERQFQECNKVGLIRNKASIIFGQTAYLYFAAPLAVNITETYRCPPCRRTAFWIRDWEAGEAWISLVVESCRETECVRATEFPQEFKHR